MKRHAGIQVTTLGCLLLLLCACQRKETIRFPLTIASWKAIGSKPTDKLPARVAELITVVSGPACEKVFVPDAKVCRIGVPGEDSPDVCKDVEVKIPMAGDPNNASLMERQIRTALAKFTVGPNLIAPEPVGKAYPAELQRFLALQRPKTQVIYLRSDGFHITVDNKPTILPTMNDVVLSLQKTFCEEVQPVLILIGVPEEPVKTPETPVDQATDTVVTVEPTPEITEPVSEDTAEPAVSDEGTEQGTTTGEIAGTVTTERSTGTAGAVPCRTESVKVSPNMRAPKNMCPPGYVGPDENCRCHPKE